MRIVTTTLFDQFKEYCVTSGIHFGKTSSYSRAIQHLCDFLNISKIDSRAINMMKGIETAINKKLL